MLNQGRGNVNTSGELWWISTFPCPTSLAEKHWAVLLKTAPHVPMVRPWLLAPKKAEKTCLRLTCLGATWKTGTRQLPLLCLIQNSPRVEKRLCRGHSSKILKGKWTLLTGAKYYSGNKQQNIFKSGRKRASLVNQTTRKCVYQGIKKVIYLPRTDPRRPKPFTPLWVFSLAWTDSGKLRQSYKRPTKCWHVST